MRQILIIRKSRGDKYKELCLKWTKKADDIRKQERKMKDFNENKHQWGIRHKKKEKKDYR